MAVLLVLLVSLLLFRGAGAAGVPLFASWSASTRAALAVMLLFTSSAHFSSMKEDLVRMVPPWVPQPRAMVLFTGFCEIAGAVGLMIPQLQHAAGTALVLFFIAVFPANVHAARTGATLGGRPATGLWLRLPMQLLFIALTWWATR